MLKKIVIDLEDKMNCDILCLRESSRKFEEWLSDPKKVANLAPFLMMFMCTSKFDVEEEQFTFMKEYLSVQEIEAANEERDTHTPDDLDPISDNEEDEQVNEVDQRGVVVYEHPPTQPPLPLTQGRPPRTSLVGIKRSAQEMNGSEDEAEPPLPTPGDGIQVTRYSTRVSKRREEDSDFEYYK